MSLIHNERTKLTATYLNGLAIALFAVGTIAPIILGINAPSAATRPVASIALVCIVASGALHYIARRVLGRLRP